MPNPTSTVSLTVKSPVMPLAKGGFYFDAEREGRVVLCINDPRFQVERPILKINDAIVVEILPDRPSDHVLYVTQVTKQRPRKW